MKLPNTQPRTLPDDAETRRKQLLLAETLQIDESRIKRFIRVSLINLKIFHSLDEIKERTEEVFQQTAARALEKAESFDANRSAYSWLNGFAANIIKQMQSRVLNRRTKYEDGFEDFERIEMLRRKIETTVLPEEEFWEKFERGENKKVRFGQLISKLKTDYQKILRLHYQNDIPTIVDGTLKDHKSGFDADKSPVFVTHLQIIGVNYSGTPKEASYREDISLASNCLPQNVSYIALGHIHKCQQIEKSAVPCWYSGSFDQMDLGERGEEKFVLSVEIDEQTKKATVEEILIDCNRFAEINISTEQLKEIAESKAEPKKSYGSLNIKYAADDDTVLLTRWADEFFPNFRRHLQREGVELIETAEFENPYNPKETVHQYLEARFGENEELLAELKRRADELILEVE